MESTCIFIPGSFNRFQLIEDWDEEDKWSSQEASAPQEMRNNEINYGIYIVKIWNEDKFLFSFYFCLFSFSNGIIKTGKSKKKIEICFHSKCRL